MDENTEKVWVYSSLALTTSFCWHTSASNPTKEEKMKYKPSDQVVIAAIKTIEAIVVALIKAK